MKLFLEPGAIDLAFLKLNRYNNKTYRIDDVAFDQNPRCTFPFHNGEQMSYVDYYKYGCKIFTCMYPNLPLVSAVMYHSDVNHKVFLWCHLKVRFISD